MTWFPKATRRDGPQQKQGYVSFPKRTLLDITGLVGHSMEGGLTAALGELDNPSRTASWPFSNPKQGPLLQHYPLESICWTNGSINSNFLFVGVEHEGVAGELINLNQRQNLADLLSWLDYTCPNIKGWERGRSLFEHREMTAYGSQPTACPSNRIPWAQVLALMEDDMDPALEAKLKRFFLEPHGQASYDAAYPGRENWTQADVVFVALAYLDGVHLTTILNALKAIQEAGVSVDLQPVLDAIKNLKLAAAP